MLSQPGKQTVTILILPITPSSKSHQMILPHVKLFLKIKRGLDLVFLHNFLDDI